MIQVTQPKPPQFPLVVSVPHAGIEIPNDLQASFATVDPIVLKRDSDLFVDELYESVPVFGGYLIVTPISRYVIDPNRDASVVDASFVEQAPLIDNPRNLGLVAHKTTSGEQLLKKPLTQDELKDRIKKYYKPFHDHIAQLIEKTQSMYGFCVHIDAHSMPSQATADHKDAGSQRKDIVLANLNGTSCDPGLTDLIEEHFLNNNFTVSRNDPYQGGFIVKNYGKPDKGVHSIMIELNRKLYMDEEKKIILPDKFESLKNTIENLVYKVRKWQPNT